MPNGFTGSKEEWERIEAPLHEIDEILKNFASKHDLTFSKNYHNWPERSLESRFFEDGIRRLIQIFLHDHKKMTYHFWLCADIDQIDGRYWKMVFFKENVFFDEIKSNLERSLIENYNLLLSWKIDDLKPTDPKSPEIILNKIFKYRFGQFDVTYNYIDNE
jgi:hypothetical protein